MTTDPTIIDKIVSIVAQAHINSDLEGVNAIMLQKDERIESLEPFHDKPFRFRHLFETSDINQFIDYCNDNIAKSGQLIAVNPDTMTALAVLDLGSPSDPQWGNHKALFRAKKTPEFGALLENNGKWLSQRQMHEFILDWQFVLDFDELTAPQAAQLVRKLTTQAVSNSESALGNFSSAKTAMEQIEIKSTAATLPEEFKFESECFRELGTQALYCMLYARTDGKEPQLSYRIIELQKQLDLIAKDICDTIQNDCKAVVRIGTFD